MTVDSLQKTTILQPYQHARLENKRRFLRFLIRAFGLTLLAKLDGVEGLDNIPAEGPAIIMMNHIAFIDSIIVLHLVKRNIVPLAKVEVFDYPVINIFPKMWEVIPVRREEVDRRAIQLTLDVLRAGEIVLVAPEGTRGVALQQGKEGIAYMASRSRAPIIPAAVTGTVGFPALRGTRAWRTPGAHVRFGKPFRFREAYSKARGDDLRTMTDEAMFVLASLLPEAQRGVYANLASATCATIEPVEHPSLGRTGIEID